MIVAHPSIPRSYTTTTSRCGNFRLLHIQFSLEIILKKEYLRRFISEVGQTSGSSSAYTLLQHEQRGILGKQAKAVAKIRMYFLQNK